MHVSTVRSSTITGKVDSGLREARGAQAAHPRPRGPTHLSAPPAALALQAVLPDPAKWQSLTTEFFTTVPPCLTQVCSLRSRFMTLLRLKIDGDRPVHAPPTSRYPKGASPMPQPHMHSPGLAISAQQLGARLGTCGVKCH